MNFNLFTVLCAVCTPTAYIPTCYTFPWRPIALIRISMASPASLGLTVKTLPNRLKVRRALFELYLVWLLIKRRWGLGCVRLNNYCSIEIIILPVLLMGSPGPGTGMRSLPPQQPFLGTKWRPPGHTGNTGKTGNRPQLGRAENPVN